MSHCAYCLPENKFIDFYYNYKKMLVGQLVGQLTGSLYIASFFFASFSDREQAGRQASSYRLLRLLGLPVYSSLLDICIPILGILSPNMLRGLFRIRRELKE